MSGISLTAVLDDALCGRARLQLKDETWLEGWFKDSRLHGFCRKFDKYKNLTWIGIYRNGKPFGKLSHKS